MIIDSYSLYKKDLTKKHKYTLIECSSVYEPLHIKGKRTPEVALYIGKPEAVRCKHARKPTLALTVAGGKHLTGLYIPDSEHPSLAFGDFEQDAILCRMVDNLNTLELFIAKGKKTVAAHLYSLLAEGDHDLLAELEEAREKAKYLTNKGVFGDSSCPEPVSR
jgi:hypothetical protein